MEGLHVQVSWCFHRDFHSPSENFEGEAEKLGRVYLVLPPRLAA